MNIGSYRDLNGIFSILVLWAYLLMVKSNFDDLSVIWKLRTWATTFILGVRVRIVEKVVEKLGIYNGNTQKSGSPELSNGPYKVPIRPNIHRRQDGPFLSLNTTSLMCLF